MKLGIVVSETYWEDITSKMLELAKVTALENNVDFEVVKVPGSFEIPLATKRLLPKVDGIVTLGAVISGKTKHDEIIMYSISNKLINLSLEFNKPVVLGINGPSMTRQQGIARINRAKMVTETCVSMINE